MRALPVLVGAVLLAATAAVASGTHSAFGASGGWVDSVAEEDQLIKFEAAAEAAGALGFYHDDEAGSLVVLVPSSKLASFDLEDLGLAPVPVTLRATKIDAMGLQLANERLAAYARSLARGESMSFYFNPRTERIEVSASTDVADVLAAVADSRPLITYRQGGVALESRYNDFAPFWGGSALDWKDMYDPVIDCTSGFAVTNGAIRGLMTVAHCGPVNVKVLSPDADREIGTAATGKRWCPTYGLPPSNNADLQLITGKTYDNTIYIGNRTGGAGIVELTPHDPAIGVTYAVSGAKTYEHVDMEVLSLSGSVTDNACGVPGSLTTVIVSKNSSSSCPTDQGDSGAPFYWRENGTPVRVGIRGMHVGASLSHSECYALRYELIHDVTGYWAITE